MPVTRRTTDRKLETLSRNQLIEHITLSQPSQMMAKPLSELTDANGNPTFDFMRECHDRYHEVAERYNRYRADPDLITRYDVFAIAVLKYRARQRRNFANYIQEPDIEHPDVTRLMVTNAENRFGSDLSRLIQRINRERGN